VITVRGTGRYDPVAQLEEAVGVYELFVDGRLVETELDEWARRFWTPEQVTAVLTDAGFADVRVTRAYSDGPPHADDPLLSVQAVAPGGGEPAAR
jgi:hypothetical protein